MDYNYIRKVIKILEKIRTTWVAPSFFQTLLRHYTYRTWHGYSHGSNSYGTCIHFFNRNLYPYFQENCWRDNQGHS